MSEFYFAINYRNFQRRLPFENEVSPPYFNIHTHVKCFEPFSFDESPRTQLSLKQVCKKS